MDPREFNHADLDRSSVVAAPGVAAREYRIELRVSVRDARSLWAAAAAKALAIGLMTLEDVQETLGPSEDPSIADCLSLLAEPAALPGCSLETFTVSRVASGFDMPAAIAA